MEVIKKTLLRQVTTGTTVTPEGVKIIIIPDLSIEYHMKIGLKSIVKDIGIFDAIEYIPVYFPYYYGNPTIPIGLNNLII